MLYPTPTDDGNVCIKSTFPAVELRALPYNRPEGLPRITSAAAAVDFLSDWLSGCTVEHMVLLCLDREFRPICFSPLAKGNPTRADFAISDTLRTCLLARSDRCMVLHNHPLGAAQPSAQDIEVAKHLHQSMWDCGILLLDFAIVAGVDADDQSRYSMFDARVGPYTHVGQTRP